MASRDRELPTEGAAPEVTGARYVVVEGEDGSKTLEVAEGQLEQRYGVGDDYGRMLLLALCQAQGLRPYRRARQQRTTVCVRATPSQHEALWQRFLSLSRELDSRLLKVADEFVREEVEQEGAER